VEKNDYKFVKISKLELTAVLLFTVFLAFAGGWFLRGNTGGAIRVETQRTLSAGEEVLSLPAPTPAPGLAQGEKVDINTADAETLRKLPGIGIKRAEDIVAYREEHGPFRIIEELTNVKGIGEGTLAGLIDYITVSEDTGGTE